MRRAALLLPLLFAVSSSVAAPEAPRPLSDRGVENLSALARLIAYVRWFHPSRESADVDWDRFTVQAVRDVENASDAAELERVLRATFARIAPTVHIHRGGSAAPPLPAALRRPAKLDGVKVVSWEHVGLGNGSSPVYTSARMSEDLLADGTFPARANDPAQPLVRDIGAGLTASIPLALWELSHAAKPAAATTTSPNADALSGDDRATRLAAVMIFWGAMEHFYPYFDAVDVDWDAELQTALCSAALDPDAILFQRGTLRRMMAALDDGHGSVTGPGTALNLRAMPLVWELVEGKLLVIRASPEYASRLKTGDEVIEIDGRPALERFEEEAALVSSATEGWRRSLAVRRMRTGPMGATCRLRVRDADGEVRAVAMPFDTQLSLDFPDYLGDSGLPPTRELRPGVWYLDINRVDDETFEKMLGDLGKAKGIIFDFRGYPATEGAMLPRIIGTEAIRSAHFQVPVIRRPHLEGVTYREGRWNITPKEPILTAKKVFITSGRAISYAESLLGIVEAYRLGAIVGEPTAGTNGNVNSIVLPGGFRMGFTGMLVTKHDGSRHHGVGILPTIPVSRTIAGVRAGRDEMLERAIAAIE